MTEPVQAEPGEATVLTLEFDATKTALVGGKTTWVAGDKVRIYSAKGTWYYDAEVVAADAGKASAQVEINFKDTLYYAVYPVESANGISGGKVGIKIPNNPDGRFDSANICVGEVHNGSTLQMHNVTGVMKITVSSGNVIEILQFSSQNGMNGTYSVDASGDVPVVTEGTTTKSATVAVGGIDRDYYIPVGPGTYDAEFSVTALRGNGGYQTLTSTKANVVAINTIVPLGVIGNDLSKGLSGEGTESSPYLITNIGEYGAFTASVNLGNPYTGKVVKLDTDVADIKTPIGYYVASDEQFPFSGTFLGNNHTIGLNLDGGNCKVPNFVGAFGLIGPGATVKDLTVSGTVSSTGDYIGGLAGYISGTDDERATVQNVQCTASVEGANQVSGIAGYACYTTVENCTNKGAITGDTNAAGIVGYAYNGNVKNCKNEGAIVGKKDCGRVLFLPAGSHVMAYLDATSTVSYGTISTQGIGGITGWTQNVTVEGCSNVANISGVSKVAGISGALYWSTSKSNTNSGTITASSDFAGGISGWNYTSATNSDDINTGAVSGRAAVGGIVGMTNNGISSAVMTVKNCKNTGAVTSTGKVDTKFYNYGFGSTSAAGGIIGLAVEYYNGSGDRYLALTNCTNEGSVVGEGNAVGGIVGMRAVPMNNQQKGYIDGCVNNGNVESKLYRAGGIAGVTFDRFENSGFEIRNCVNHGTVKAPYVVAGIVSWTSSAYPAAAVTNEATAIRIINCYNDGEIVYSKTAYDDGKGPYAAGIVGYNQKVRVYNCYNGGAIKPTDGSAPNEYDSKLLGEVNACLGRYAFFNYLYARSSDFNINGPQAVNSPIGEMGDVLGRVKTDGTLESPVTVKNKDYDTPEAALNAWIAGVTASPTLYYKWKKGPVFDK